MPQDFSRICSNRFPSLPRVGCLVGGLALATFLAGCLLEQAQLAANQIGLSRYEDMVGQLGSPFVTDHTFTGKLRATWKSSFTNSEGRITADQLILVFGEKGILEKVTYKDGSDDHHLINLFSGSFTCDERGKYPGGPAWPRDDGQQNQTPDTIRETRVPFKGSPGNWRSR